MTGTASDGEEVTDPKVEAYATLRRWNPSRQPSKAHVRIVIPRPRARRLLGPITVILRPPGISFLGQWRARYPRRVEIRRARQARKQRRGW